jgi:hypothetical protein
MIAVGVDTHTHEHVAKALDGLGQVVGGLQIKANLDGYLELLEWLRTLKDDVAVGIEGTGSYGAGMCELLLAAGIQVVEVERPRREERRRGKSDEIDALLAAKKVLAGDGLSTPRAGTYARPCRRCSSRSAPASASAPGCSTSCRRCTQAHRSRCASGSVQATAERSSHAFTRCAPGKAHPRQNSSSSPCCATSPAAPVISRAKPAPTSANSAA